MHNLQKQYRAVLPRCKLLGVTIAFGLLFCIGPAHSPVQAQPNTYRGRQIIEETMGSRVVRYVDGLYMIRFHEYVTPAEKKDFIAQHGLEPYRDESSTGRWHVRGIPSSDNRARIANFLTESVIAKAALIRIKKVVQGGNESRPSGIESSEGSSPKNSYSSLLYDEDQYYEWQWYLNNTGTIEEDSTGATPDADINAPEAWAIEEGKSLFVAVLDSGIPLNGQGNLDHDDLKNVGTTREIELFEWAADFTGESDLDDVFGHGTQVTGVLTATKDNGDGIAGLVTENIHVVPVKVIDEYGYAAILDVASAIDDIIYNLGIENPSYDIILSLSIGWYGDEEDEDIRELKYTVSNANNLDVLMVCAIGNVQADSVLYPAAFSTSYSNVIAVGSTNWNDEVSDNSATGNQITVVAPGGGSNGTYKGRFQQARQLVTTTADGVYEWCFGTSLATPLVAGLAALVWSYRPDYDPEEVRQAIIDNAVDIGEPFNRAGNGRIDAYATLSNIMDDATAPTGLWGTYTRYETVELEWNRNPVGQKVNKYWLQRSDDDGEFYDLDKNIGDPGSGTMVYYVDYEPESEVDWHRYRVKAYNILGWGPFCGPITVWIGERPPKRVGTESAPEELILEPNYPNPFKLSTQIKFGLPSTSHVRLQILNIRGQTIKILADGITSAGWHTAIWDGKNESGREVASGIYLYLIEVDNKTILKKLTIIR